MQALLVTVFGGLVMLLGFVLLGQAARTYRISEIVAWGRTARSAAASVAVALVLILVGALTKSAQLPFHPWLPAAMAAPTPVSAYLHAASMVKAGVYLVARLAAGFADQARLVGAHGRARAARPWPSAAGARWRRPTSSGCWPSAP